MNQETPLNANDAAAEVPVVRGEETGTQSPAPRRRRAERRLAMEAEAAREGAAFEDADEARGAGVPQNAGMARGAGVPQDTPLPQDTPIPQNSMMPRNAPLPQDAPLPQNAPLPQDAPTPHEDYAPRRTRPAPQNAPPVPYAPYAPSGDIALSPPPAQSAANRQTSKRRFFLPGKLPLALLLIVCVGLFIANGAVQGTLSALLAAEQSAYERTLERHPFRYRALIEQEAVSNNLHPAFIAAIILCESSYNKNAESGVGARGLMQLMPETADEIAEKLISGEAWSFERMFEPELNVRFGCYYLSTLAKQFGGNPILVASAYHAGRGTVRNWLADSSVSEDGRTFTLENMPRGNTQTYARRVTQVYAIYKSLYYTQSGGSDAV